MNVKKFIAANARDALRKVKETLGNDAIILSNRGIPGGVEIMAVAARDMAMIVPTPVAEPLPPSSHSSAINHAVGGEDEGGDYRVALSSARAHVARENEPKMPPASWSEREQPVMHSGLIQRVAGAVNAGIPKSAGLRNLDAGIRAQQATAPQSMPQASAKPARLQPDAPLPKKEADVIPLEVMDEIRSLRRIVEQHLAGIAWGEATRSQPVKAEVTRLMLDAGFSPQFSRELLDELPLDMDFQQAQAWVKGAADRSLLTISNDDDIVDRGGVYALVGPTGVGKTTTTAKLAARCVLRHGPSKIALVTTDSYRIGAHEQLRIYGRILGVSVYLAKDAAELQQTLRELRHKHMVLVDTMGMSQKDRLVPEMTDMLAGCDVKRLLLLSATSRGDTLDDVIAAYKGPSLVGCIMTKIDEAATLAPALDSMMRHGLRLYYVSNGQRVPEDIHLPNRGYLLHRALRELPDQSAHRYDGHEPGMLMGNAGVAAVGGVRG